MSETANPYGASKPEHINLFFLRKASFACIVTTKEEISEPYHRLIRVPLEKAKPWDTLTFRGALDKNHIWTLAEFNDEKYFFINVQHWDPAVKEPLYWALKKEIASGMEYATEDLRKSIAGSSCNPFLFPKKIDIPDELQARLDEALHEVSEGELNTQLCYQGNGSWGRMRDGEYADIDQDIEVGTDVLSKLDELLGRLAGKDGICESNVQVCYTGNSRWGFIYDGNFKGYYSWGKLEQKINQFCKYFVEPKFF